MGSSTGRKCRPSREFRPQPRHLMQVSSAPSFTQAGLSPQNEYLMDQAPHPGLPPRFRPKNSSQQPPWLHRKRSPSVPSNPLLVRCAADTVAITSSSKAMVPR